MRILCMHSQVYPCVCVCVRACMCVCVLTNTSSSHVNVVHTYDRSLANGSGLSQQLIIENTSFGIIRWQVYLVASWVVYREWELALSGEKSFSNLYS